MRRVLNNKVLLFIVAVLLLANIAQLIYAFGTKDRSKRSSDDGHRSPITVFLKKDIGFNARQMSAFEGMRQQNKQKMRLLFQDMRLSKVAFYNLLSNASIDDTVLNRAALAIAEKQKAIELQTFQNFREIRKLSTAEQLPKYDSLIPGLIGNMWFPAPGHDNFHGNKDSLNIHH